MNTQSARLHRTVVWIHQGHSLCYDNHYKANTPFWKISKKIVKQYQNSQTLESQTNIKKISEIVSIFGGSKIKVERDMCQWPQHWSSGFSWPVYVVRRYTISSSDIQPMCPVRKRAQSWMSIPTRYDWVYACRKHLSRRNPAMRLFWSFFGNLLRLLWNSFETLLRFVWDYVETLLRLLWDSWDYVETLLKLFWDNVETLLRLLKLCWDFCETMLRLFWY